MTSALGPKLSPPDPPFAGTTIRPATLADLDAVVAMGQRFHRSTTYASLITEHPDQMASLASLLITQPHGDVLVAEDHTRTLVGMIGLLIFPHPLSGEHVASEMFLWVEPTARGSLGIRLLKRAEQWVKDHGIDLLLLAAPTAGIGAIYERLGYRLAELAYARRLA